MSRRAGVDIRTSVYSTFKGADFASDPSNVDEKRSPFCTNIMADAGGMPEKRPGWRTLYTFEGQVNGIFSGVFVGSTVYLCHAGTKLYSWDETETDPVELLTGLPDNKSRALAMGGRLWIVTGAGYLVYDGSTAQPVTASGAYVPTTVVTRTPSGGGSPYESINLLTPYRKNAFQTDGTARDFTLDSNVDATGEVSVWVWGTEMTAGTDFTVDRENGTVTMTTAPAAPDAGSADGLVVQFPHTTEGYSDMIDKCTIMTTYGVGTNDRMVLSGNPDFPNRDWISGMDDPSYFPDLGYSTVGADRVPILGYLRVGSSLGVVKAENGQDTTVFLRSAALDSSGKAVFTLQQAISGVGAVSRGSFAALMSDPLFLARTGITALTTNSYTSERITQNRSFFVNARLTAETGLSEAEAVIWNGMYLLSVGNGHVYIMDARQDRSYRAASMGDYVYECYYWENVPARCWLCQSGEETETLYFGTAEGKLCRFRTDDQNMTRFADDDDAISAAWATKYDDDGTPATLKTLIKRGCCVTIKPYTRSSAEVYLRSDRTGGGEQRVAGAMMDILDWEDIDFERFTFSTDTSPREVYFHHKVKNYKRLQIVVRNNVVNEGFGIYKITKLFVVGNYSKR